MAFINDFKTSLLYPFDDSQWINKLWPLPLLAAIPVLGLLSVIVLKGWRFFMVKQLANGRTDLPDFQLVDMLRTGALLWVVMLGHVLIPGVLCSILGIGGPLGFLSDLWEIVTSGFDAWARSEPGDWLLTLLIYLVWGIISIPVFQSGMIRYALSGNWKTMLNAPANFLFFLRHAHHFIKFYVCWLLLTAMIVMADAALALTGIGLLLIPVFTVCAYYITTAYELGQLAMKVRKPEPDSSIVEPAGEQACG